MCLKEPNFQTLDQDFYSYRNISYSIQLSCRTVLNWLMVLSFIGHQLQLRSKSLLYEFNHYNFVGFFIFFFSWCFQSVQKLLNPFVSFFLLLFFFLFFILLRSFFFLSKIIHIIATLRNNQKSGFCIFNWILCI